MSNYQKQGFIAGATLKIESVEIIGLDIVPAHRRRMSPGAYVYSEKGGWAGRPVMFGIRAGGITGWGEARPINPFVGDAAASMFSNLRDFYAPLLIGRDAMQIEAALQACERTLPSNPATLATIDMAQAIAINDVGLIPIFFSGNVGATSRGRLLPGTHDERDPGHED